MIKPLIDPATSLPRGRIKTFGPLGPKYEIVGSARPLAGNDALVRIRLVETGEETDYSYARLRQDPDAS